MKLRALFLSGCGLFVTVTLTSCSEKPLTPYEKYKIAQMEKSAVTTLRVNGTLVDKNDKPVAGMKVSTASGRFEEETYTASDGRFSVMTKFEPDDSLDFRFEGTRTEWTESLGFIPKGIDTLTLRFQLDDLGKVRLAAYEY